MEIIVQFQKHTSHLCHLFQHYPLQRICDPPLLYFFPLYWFCSEVIVPGVTRLAVTPAFVSACVSVWYKQLYHCASHHCVNRASGV